MGEREARVICPLVKQRHFGFAHGIGRSGDILEVQPKAAGSSLLYKLCNSLLLNFCKEIGLKSLKEVLVLPLATGMGISLVLQSLKAEAPTKKYVLWLRIDQKSAFKAISAAGLIPIVVENKLDGMSVCSDLTLLLKEIIRIGAENILCVLSTSSCFAPRSCDNLAEIASLCKLHGISHVVNNAYGLQSDICLKEINKAAAIDKNLIVVQSTDKNLLVPVGGSFVLTFSKDKAKLIASSYPGRASMSPILDVFITLLFMGKKRLVSLKRDRMVSGSFDQ